MARDHSVTPAAHARADAAAEVARQATEWLLGQGFLDTGEDPSLYNGLGGILLGVHEAHQHFGDKRYGDAVAQGADLLEHSIEHLDDSSLYFGLAGVAVVLRRLGRSASADTALRSVRDASDGQRWNQMFELFVGNAGIGLAALHAGDLDLAVDAVTPYLEAADPTSGGVNWPVRPSPPRSHHIAHGTLGIVYALAAVGDAAGREDLVDLALAGAADVVSRNESGPDGFLVPHSDPPHRPELIERYAYGWCNGPAGDAQVFRLLLQITGDGRWTTLGEQCWHTVVTSGVPQRLRPGFWDNNGRCCGTAGVLAIACDRLVERGDDPDFGDRLVDDLVARATVDPAGARWANHEHRGGPRELEALPGWAMGNAGIIRELLRYARIRQGSGTGYAVPWPDHPDGSAGRAVATGPAPGQ